MARPAMTAVPLYAYSRGRPFPADPLRSGGRRELNDVLGKSYRWNIIIDEYIATLNVTLHS